MSETIGQAEQSVEANFGLEVLPHLDDFFEQQAKYQVAASVAEDTITLAQSTREAKALAEGKTPAKYTYTSSGLRILTEEDGQPTTIARDYTRNSAFLNRMNAFMYYGTHDSSEGAAAHEAEQALTNEALTALCGIVEDPEIDDRSKAIWSVVLQDSRMLSQLDPMPYAAALNELLTKVEEKLVPGDAMLQSSYRDDKESFVQTGNFASLRYQPAKFYLEPARNGVRQVQTAGNVDLLLTHVKRAAYETAGVTVNSIGGPSPYWKDHKHPKVQYINLHSAVLANSLSAGGGDVESSFLALRALLGEEPARYELNDRLPVKNTASATKGKTYHSLVAMDDFEAETYLANDAERRAAAIVLLANGVAPEQLDGLRAEQDREQMIQRLVDLVDTISLDKNEQDFQARWRINWSEFSSLTTQQIQRDMQFMGVTIDDVAEAMVKRIPRPKITAAPTVRELATYRNAHARVGQGIEDLRSILSVEF